jgi:sugar lactone lactonase YvrE
LHKLVQLAIAAVAVLAFAPAAQAQDEVEIFVQVSVTNNTPTNLTLVGADRGDASGTYWSDSQGNEIGSPAIGSQLAPGATASFYIAGSEALLPDIEGSIEYRDQDSSTGFFGSGLRIAFHDPPFASNTASPQPRGFYTASGFTYSQHNELVVSTGVVATDTCPGSGTGPCAYSADHSIGSSGTGPGQFQRPVDVAVDTRPVVYASDVDLDTIQVFNPSGNYLTGWGSAGSGNGQFLDPIGVAAQPVSPGPGSGLVAVADLSNNRIQSFTPFGQFQDVWTDGGFGALRAVTVGADGSVYVVVGTIDDVFKFTSTGQFLTSFTSSRFQVPWDIAIDPSTGNVVVLDSQADTVFRFTPDGQQQVSSFAIGGSPEGLAVDRSGNAYVTDGRAGTVTKYGPSGNRLASWGALGDAAGEFQDPRGIAVDNGGNVYVADAGNDRLQVFAPAGAQLQMRSAPKVSRTGMAGARLRCVAPRGATCRGTLTIGTARRFTGRRAIRLRSGRSTLVRIRLNGGGRRLARRNPSALTAIAHTRQPQARTRVTHRRPLRRR